MTEQMQTLEDEKWTKTAYMRNPIWEEVKAGVNEIANAMRRTSYDDGDIDGHHDWAEKVAGRGMTEEEWEIHAAQRQVALAIYANLHDKFHGDSDMLKKYTRNQQSHWNFMLLGQAWVRGHLDHERTLFRGRQEQFVTLHFLCKCIMRMRLLGVEFDWGSLSQEMVDGARFRVMSSPMRKPQRNFWIKKYGEQKPWLHYPAPWKIAEEFCTPPIELGETQTLRCWHFDPVAKVDCYGEFEYEREVRSCTVQNDGVFFIPGPGDGRVVEGEVFEASIRPWFLKGMEEPDGLSQLDDPSIDRARFKEILRDALNAAMKAEQRAKDLERTVAKLEAEVARNEDIITGLTRTQRDLTLVLKQVRDLVDPPDRHKVFLSKD